MLYVVTTHCLCGDILAAHAQVHRGQVASQVGVAASGLCRRLQAPARLALWHTPLVPVATVARDAMHAGAWHGTKHTPRLQPGQHAYIHVHVSGQ